MQSHLGPRPSPSEIPRRTPNWAICHVAVDFVKQPVVHLASVVYAHEGCALNFPSTPSVLTEMGRSQSIYSSGFAIHPELAGGS